MLPERNHYWWVTKRCNSLWMSWILTGFLQNEYIPCNYNPRFPPAFTAQAVLTKVHKKHETGLTTRSLSKAKTIKLNQSPSHQPIAGVGNLGSGASIGNWASPDHFHLLQGQGHAADGEVGGGDGPQTCHTGVKDWDGHTPPLTQAAAETTRTPP